MTSEPPAAYDAHRVMTPGDRTLYWLLSGVLISVLWSFGRYWAGVPEWSDRPWIMVGLTGVIVLFVAQYLQSWTTLPAMRRPVPPAPPEGLRVAMVTTFVPGVESLDMLDATVEAMSRVRVAHDVWVLDEAADPDVAEICLRHGARTFSRQGRPDLATDGGPLRARTKYGNVNAWLREVGFDGYDVVATFDPDHVPEADFLERTLGYLRDPSVGFVQGAQVYYNQGASFIARGAAEETYGYYSSTLPAGFGAGYTVMVGCHTVHRVAALREVGGLAPHDADDLLTALHYEVAGWRGVYVPEVLAAGLTPVGWPTYLVQQRRWARSVLDLKLRRVPGLWRDLRPASRVFALLQGAAYPIEAVLPAAGGLLVAWMLVVGETSVLSRLFGHQFLLLLLALAGISLFRQRFFLVPEVERGFHWRAGIVRGAKWPFVAWGLAEGLLGVRRRYEVTGKSGAGPRGGRLLLPHLALALIVAVAWVGALWTDRIVHWSLHFWAPVTVLGSLGIFLTAFLPRPEAFDASLLRNWRARWRALASSPPARPQPWREERGPS